MSIELKQGEFLGVVYTEVEYYDPDPGNPMSRTEEILHERIIKCANEEEFIEEYQRLKSRKKTFKCFIAREIKPELNILLEIQ